MSNRVISTTGAYTGYSAAVSVDAANDYMLIQQSGAYKKVSRNVLLGVTGTPMDTSTAQNVSNKSLGNTNTITVKDSLLTVQNASDTTKQAVLDASGITTGTTRTITLPNASTTLVGRNTTDTLTGKTLTSPTITGGTYDNGTITVDSIGEHTAANGVTIDGMNIKDGKLNTSNSVVTASVTDAAITPAKLLAGTGSGWAWTAWTPTWTNLTLGNGTQVGRYNQTGKTVNGYLLLTFGTTTAATGTISLTLPVTAIASMVIGGSFVPLGQAIYIDTGTAGYDGAVFLTSATTMQPVVYNAAGTYLTDNAVTATVPFAPGTGDYIFLRFNYEAA